MLLLPYDALIVVPPATSPRPLYTRTHTDDIISPRVENAYRRCWFIGWEDDCFLIWCILSHANRVRQKGRKCTQNYIINMIFQMPRDLFLRAGARRMTLCDLPEMPCRKWESSILFFTQYCCISLQALIYLHDTNFWYKEIPSLMIYIMLVFSDINISLMKISMHFLKYARWQPNAAITFSFF